VKTIKYISLWRIAAAILILAALLLARRWMAVRMFADNISKREPNNLTAFSMCETFVTRSLKAPATAKFARIADSSTTESLIYTTDEKNVPYTIHKYTVTSYVDAQNSFGAMLRTSLVCQVEPTESGQWKLLDLDTQ
jgi:hypothetical protein